MCDAGLGQFALGFCLGAITRDAAVLEATIGGNSVITEQLNAS